MQIDVRGEFEQVKADAAAEVARANEGARAAEARAEQRIAERASAQAAGEQAVQQVRGKLEQVKADAAAEVAAAHGKASGEIAAARQAIKMRFMPSEVRTYKLLICLSGLVCLKYVKVVAGQWFSSRPQGLLWAFGAADEVGQGVGIGVDALLQESVEEHSAGL